LTSFVLRGELLLMCAKAALVVTPKAAQNKHLPEDAEVKCLGIFFNAGVIVISRQ
jgi:hypothetical protein